MANPYLPPVLPSLGEELPRLSYAEVLRHYDEDRKKNPQFSQLTLPEYARSLNDATQSQMFDQATTTGFGGLVKRASAGINQALEATGIPVGAAYFGSLLADPFVGGNDEKAAEFGSHFASAPRSFANMAPMIATAPFSGGLSLLGLAGTGLLSGGQTYEETGSPLAGAISGATAMALPKAFGAASNQALKLTGATLKDEAGHLVGSNIGQRLAGYTGGQLGALGTMEAGHQLQSVAQGNGLDTDPAHFVDSLIGQLPFLAFDLPNLMQGGKIANAIKAKNLTAERGRLAEENARLDAEGNARYLSRFDPRANAEVGAPNWAAGKTLGQEFLKPSLPQLEIDAQGIPLPGQQQVAPTAPSLEPLKFSPDAVPRAASTTFSPDWMTGQGEAPAAPTVQAPSYRETLQAAAQREVAPIKTGVGEEYLPDKKPTPDSTLFGEPLPQKPAMWQPETKAPGESDYTPDWYTESIQKKQEAGQPISRNEADYLADKLRKQKAKKDATAAAKPAEVKTPEVAQDLKKAEDAAPKPLTNAIVDSTVKPLLSEKDSKTAISKIKGVYEKVLKPQYGVHDVALEQLTDEALQKKVIAHMEAGASLDEAVINTANGIKNVLENATKKTQAKVLSDDTRAIIERIKGKFGGGKLGTFGVPDLSVIPDIVELGYSVGKDLMKVGALKIQEWREMFLQSLKEHFGIEADDSQLGAVENLVRQRLNADDQGGDVVHSPMRARLEQSMESLNHLDEGWDKLPDDVKGNKKSPLEKVTMWRNDILDQNPQYGKYAEVDEAILRAAGDLSHNGQVWLDKHGVPLKQQDASVKSYLKQAAKNEYKSSTKREQGGQEVAYDEEEVNGQTVRKPLDYFKDLNEANIKADEMNKALVGEPDYVYEGGIKGRTTKNPKYVVYKTYKKFTSLEEQQGFKPERQNEAPEEETDTAVHDETSDERDAAGRKSLEALNEEGEFDPIQESVTIADRVAASSDEIAGEVAMQHVYDIVHTVLDRLDPIKIYVSGASHKPGELVARLRLMIDYLQDARLPGMTEGIDWKKFVAEANPKLVDQNWHFEGTDNISPEKQANNWWNKTGYPFFKEWATQQPELMALKKGAKPEVAADVSTVGAGPTVKEATAAREPDLRLDAISEARTDGKSNILRFPERKKERLKAEDIKPGMQVEYNPPPPTPNQRTVKGYFVNEDGQRLYLAAEGTTKFLEGWPSNKGYLLFHDVESGKTLNVTVDELQSMKFGSEQRVKELLDEIDYRPKSDLEGNVVKGQFAKMTVTDFTRDYFSRLGQSLELAQRSTDAVQRLARAVAFFRGGETARVTLSELPPDVAGRAIQELAGQWAPLVQLNRSISNDSFLTLIAGHEGYEVLLHQLNAGEFNGDVNAVKAMHDRAESMSPAERSDMLGEAISQLPKNLRTEITSDPRLQGLLDYSSANSKEFVATLAGVHVLSATEPKSGLSGLRDTLIYGDGYVSRMVSGIFKVANRLMSALRGVGAAVDSNLISDASDFSLSASKADLAHFNELFKTVRNSEKVIQAAVSKLTTIDALQPDSFINAVQNGYIPDVTRTGDKAIDEAMGIAYARILPQNDPKEIGRTGRIIMDFAQLAEMHPTLRPIFGEMLDYQALANDSARNAQSPLFTRDFVRGKVVVGEVMKEVQTLAKSTKLREAFSDQVLSEQTLGRVMNESELSSVYAKHALSPAERQSLQKTRTAFSQMHQIVGEQIVRFGQEQIKNSVARLLMAGNDTPKNNALKGAARIVESIMSGPVASLDLSTSLGITPEKVAVGMSAAQELLGHYKGLVEAVTNRPEFVSEQRFGRYAASYTVEGNQTPGRVAADSRAELEKKIAQVSAGGKVSNIQRYDNADQSFAGISPDVISKFKEIGDIAYKRTYDILGKEQAEGARLAFQSFSTDIEKELMARGVGRFTQKRTFAPGRETLDMLENGMRYVSTVPRALAKVWLRERAELALQDPEMIQNPSAQKVARQQVNNLLANEASWASKAKAFVFQYYLGSNISSALVEQLQPMLAVPAQLVKDGSGVGSAYKKLSDAYVKVTQAYAKDRFDDPFISDVIHRLDSSGILEQQTMGNFRDFTDDLAGINLSRATDGKITPMSIAEAGRNMVSHVGSVSRNLYSRATGVSSRVTAVAAALHAKEMIADGSMKPEDAFDYVRKVVTLTAPGTGGRAARPVGIYSGEETRSAVGVLTSLQGYTISMYSMMGRLARDAVKSGSITSSSSKAFMLMAGTQLLAAGVLGLPGIGTAINVANSAFPDLNIKANLRTALANLMGDDEETGALFSDLAMRGLPNMVTGVDLSARLSLSNMLGVSDYDGFNMSHLLGAPGGIVNNLYHAAELTSRGEFGNALEAAAPTAIKNVLKVFRDTGNVRDAQGNLKYEPSAGEQFGMAIGFTPKKVADMREFTRLAAQMEKSASHEQERFITNAAQMLQDGDMSGVRQALIEREKERPGEFNSAEGLKLVVRKMQDMSFPEDPRRGGSKLTLQDRADLMRSYGTQEIGPSEQARVTQQHQILQQFGLVGGTNSADFMRAGMVDLVMRQNTNMTRAQARQYVEGLLKKHADRSLGQ